jgi:ABC-type transporter Mla maintaining outer membrane lipid asymmetry ATPase subunit MlaF
MDVVVDVAHVQGERGATRWPHPVSFQLARGQAMVIHTRSAFSAPLLRLCLGFSEPATGSVGVFGRAPATLSRNAVRAFRGSTGSVLDPDGLVSNMSVRLNLIVPLVYATGLPLAEASERADRMLEAMHLAIWAASRPPSLPAEIRQTVALARALCVRPALLLLENPLASVDARETQRLMSLCRTQAETVLVATHQTDEIMDGIADAVWDWTDEGFIARRGAPHEVG